MSEFNQNNNTRQGRAGRLVSRPANSTSPGQSQPVATKAGQHPGQGQPVAAKPGQCQYPGQGRPVAANPGQHLGQGRPVAANPGQHPGQGQPVAANPGQYPGQGQPTAANPGQHPGQGRPVAANPEQYPGQGQPMAANPAVAPQAAFIPLELENPIQSQPVIQSPPVNAVQAGASYQARPVKPFEQPVPGAANVYSGVNPYAGAASSAVGLKIISDEEKELQERLSRNEAYASLTFFERLSCSAALVWSYKSNIVSACATIVGFLFLVSRKLDQLTGSSGKSSEQTGSPEYANLAEFLESAEYDDEEEYELGGDGELFNYDDDSAYNALMDQDLPTINLWDALGISIPSFFIFTFVSFALFISFASLIAHIADHGDPHSVTDVLLAPWTRLKEILPSMAFWVLLYGSINLLSLYFFLSSLSMGGFFMLLMTPLFLMPLWASAVFYLADNKEYNIIEGIIEPFKLLGTNLGAWLSIIPVALLSMVAAFIFIEIMSYVMVIWFLVIAGFLACLGTLALSFGFVCTYAGYAYKQACAKLEQDDFIF